MTMYHFTFITPRHDADFDHWIKKSYPDIVVEDRAVLEAGKAARWTVSSALQKEIIDRIRQEFKIDVLITRADAPAPRLFLADMDSTIVKGETLDDMAAKAGVGDKIATITDKAMRGELDFEQALTARVGMLSGQPASLIDRALEELTLNPGAETLVKALKDQGVYCVLVSGGFTQFTLRVAEKLGFDAHFGNDLIIENGVVTGEIRPPVLDKHFKLQKLQSLQAEMGLEAEEIIAIGDGANDLPMLQAAGSGIGYHPKPLVKEALVNIIMYTDLESVGYLF